MADDRPLDDAITGDEIQDSAKECMGRIASDGVTIHLSQTPRRGGEGGGAAVPVKKFVEPLRGLFNLQVARDKDVTTWSLCYALYWETAASQLGGHVEILNGGAYRPFFGKATQHSVAMRDIRKRRDGQLSRHFQEARRKNFALYLHGCEGNKVWVATISRVKRLPDGSVVTDRIAVIDPYKVGRNKRLNTIKDRFADMLEAGNITITDDAVWGGLECADIPAGDGWWPAGYIVFAVVCEFYRRLRVMDHRGDLDQDPAWI
ncbi:hypothetical protein PG994_003325 [Apiospora phragmitis]|uniref:Uncharacterized protein n=1 Tax=Apiospora phragmitis TaxID=2905665 RepID=A0ABR1W1Q3_9PEZI